jgi:hypothetical protein
MLMNSPHTGFQVRTFELKGNELRSEDWLNPDMLVLTKRFGLLSSLINDLLDSQRR